jgi:hypothetical protein
MAMEMRIANTMSIPISKPLTISDPTFSDTFPPSEIAPITVITAPIRTAALTVNTFAPTAGAIASSLPPIEKATRKLMTSKAPSIRGSNYNVPPTRYA